MSPSSRIRPVRRRRGAPVAPLLVLLLGLAACAAPPAAPDEAAGLPELAAETVVHRHLVHFATDSAEPGPAERAALAAFVAALPAEARVTVLLYGGADPRAGRVYNADLAARRARAVADLLRRLGRRPTMVAGRSLGEAAARGRDAAGWRGDRRVEVVATVIRPVVRGCARPVAAGGARLGCAVEGALAAMVADPADLVRPGPLAPADAARTILAVDRYRTGRVRPLPKPEKKR